MLFYLGRGQILASALFIFGSLTWGRSKSDRPLFYFPKGIQVTGLILIIATGLLSGACITLTVTALVRTLNEQETRLAEIERQLEEIKKGSPHLVYRPTPNGEVTRL